MLNQYSCFLLKSHGYTIIFKISYTIPVIMRSTQITFPSLRWFLNWNLNVQTMMKIIISWRTRNNINDQSYDCLTVKSSVSPCSLNIMKYLEIYKQILESWKDNNVWKLCVNPSGHWIGLLAVGKWGHDTKKTSQGYWRGLLPTKQSWVSKILIYVFLNW